MKIYKWVIVVLVFVMLIGICSPITISAITLPWDYFTVNVGTQTIISYSFEGPKDVVIPREAHGLPMFYIGDQAFVNRYITSVSIPDSVISIGDRAFENNELQLVTIPDSVTSIGDYAFNYGKLQLITIGETVASIGRYAFANNRLASVTIPESVTSIGNGAFNNNRLTSVSILEGVESIGNAAFSENRLASVTIPDTVTSIGSSAFHNNGLTSLTIGGNVTFIDSNAFSMNRLEIVTIPESVTHIGSHAFSTNQLTNVYIFNSDVDFGPEAFDDNGNYVNIYAAVGSSAEDYAKTSSVYRFRNILEIDYLGETFWSGGNRYAEITGYPALYSGSASEITILNMLSASPVTRIAPEAFSDKGLTSVVIPESINRIGNNSFQNNALTSVTILNSTMEIGDDSFKNNQANPENLTIIGHEGSTAQAYASANGYSFDWLMPDSEAVEKAKESLTEDNIKNGNIDLNNVTGNLTLSTIGNYATAISWSSNNTDVVTNDGTVARPSYSAGDAVVTLTATISKGVESETKDFIVTVLKKELMDGLAVEADKAALTEDVIKGGNADLNNVMGNLILPTSGAHGTTISWESGNESIITSEGAVIPPAFTESDAVVTLTATISKGVESETKEFVITVLKEEPTDVEAVEADKAALTENVIKGGNADLNNVQSNLTLPGSGKYGTNITWISSNTDLVSVTGDVYRPSYTAGNAEVVLTAHLNKNNVSAEKPFVLKVIRMPATDEEAVVEDKNNLTVIFAHGEDADSVTQNLTLPTIGNNGSTISWLSNKPEIISNTGVVTQPTYSDGNAKVTVTATITKNNISETKTFELVVVKLPLPTTGGGGGGGTPAPSQVAGPSTTETETTVIVNGQRQIAGTETVTEENQQKIVELRVDSNILNQKIDEVLKESETDGSTTENIVEIPVAIRDAQQIKSILAGDIIKKMAEKNFSLAITTEKVDYIIPVKEIAIEEIASVLEVDTDFLKDIEIEVQINHLPEDQAKEIKEKAQAKGYEILFPTVAFKIVAKTTSATGEKKETTVTQFSSYVSRVMEIPAGADPKKITTGVVYNPDGTFSHIPTTVFEKDGKWYAKLSSITNSIYTIIWNPVTVASVEDHWSREHVNDMASRLIIKNPEAFTPNGAISRGEFAEYITKALGLYRTGASKAGQFTDVDRTNELADAITIATEYGIITGYPDGSFRPEAQISRQEAMTMYAKAMDIVGLKEGDSNRIESYTDKDQVASWAYQYVKKTISAGVFNGRTHTTIDPKGTFTYAEAAAAIRNLLTKGELINN